MAEATTEELLHAQKKLVKASSKAMCFAPYVPLIGKEIATPSLEKVLITWQRDDASPFVAMKLGHEETFGGVLDRLATRVSTSLVFKNGGRKYASHLKQHGIEACLHELTWSPEGSRFGACHCLELCLLFGTYERWQGVGMLGHIYATEWHKRSQAIRKQWLDFIK